MTVWDAVVLAGGQGRRLGGADKPALLVEGRTLLDTALDACAGARHTVIVGPRRQGTRPLRWTREDPPGTGPLAALAAGLRALPAGADVVVVLAADLPAVSAAVVHSLVAHVSEDGAVVTDSAGHRQPLLAAYRRDALDRALAAVGDPAGRPMRLVTDALAVAEVRAPEASDDIDTPGDLARWRKGDP